jgi:hypothetical protein
MALSDIKFANVRRSRRTSLGTIKGQSATERTTQVVGSGTGAAVAIRPRMTAIRRYNNAGQGEVGYF